MNCSKEMNQEMHPINKIDLDSLSFPHEMKGYELYSWPNGNDWNYSVLVGTNRIKLYEEVITNKIIVFGKDSLKMLLDRFPQNEYIFWVGKEWLGKCWGGNNFGTLSLPDNKTVNEIKAYCTQKKLKLNVSSN
jgi:hypothetical protein